MTVHIPMFYGVIVRKSEKTADYVARCKGIDQQSSPAEQQNEDANLLAVSIAMSARDSDSAAEAFERRGWARGIDFVMTIPGVGLREPAPVWLDEFEFTPDATSEVPHPRMPSEPHHAYRIASDS